MITEWEGKPDFLTFSSRIFSRNQHPPHLTYLYPYLTRIATWEADKAGDHLIVSMPPRHGKSFTISRLFPAWYLGINPSQRVILASYGATLARKHSRAARSIVASRVYAELFPEIKLAADARSADSWDLIPVVSGEAGGMDAVGVGGGITGKGAQLIIVDDPIKSRAEAESATYRDRLWEWFTDDLYTRREPGASVILVMTRWSTDDLAARLIRRQREKWTYIRLPALAEPDDLLGRAIGDPLWVARFDTSALHDIESSIGAYAWAGLYQQSPVPQSGGLFKRASFRLTQTAPPILTHAVRFWDLALSEREHADYTVGVLLGRTPVGQYVVLDVTRFRAEWSDVIPRIIETARADTSDVLVGFEQTAFQSRAVAQFLSAPGMGEYKAFGVKPEGDKFTRALPFAARAGEGMIDVLSGRGWTDDFLEELVTFPKGAHDDQVDAASGAYRLLIDMESMKPRALKVNTSRYA